MPQNRNPMIDYPIGTYVLNFFEEDCEDPACCATDDDPHTVLKCEVARFDEPAEPPRCVRDPSDPAYRGRWLRRFYYTTIVMPDDPYYSLVTAFEATVTLGEPNLKLLDPFAACHPLT